MRSLDITVETIDCHTNLNFLKLFFPNTQVLAVHISANWNSKKMDEFVKCVTRLPDLVRLNIVHEGDFVDEVSFQLFRVRFPLLKLNYF